jgi:hypothetical protein
MVLLAMASEPNRERNRPPPLVESIPGEAAGDIESSLE